MTKWAERLAAAFRNEARPAAEAIVNFDGFDQLDKQSALAAFAGKTRDEVAALVGAGPTGIQGLWGIEDLQVLEPAALRYYVEPFLRHLLSRAFDIEDDFSYFLAYHLAEAVRRRGPEVFTADQRVAVAEMAADRARQIEGEDDWPAAHRAHYERLAQLVRGA